MIANDKLKEIVRTTPASDIMTMRFKVDNSLAVLYKGKTRLTISFDSAKDRAEFHQEILDKMRLEAQ